MNSIHATTTEFINNLCMRSLDLTSPERALLFGCLVKQARDSQHALEIVREIYHLAATGEWKPSLGDLSTLIYAPLDNPSLIPDIEPYMGEILNCYPAQAQLRSGWRYVQAFSCSPSFPHPRGVTCFE